MLSLLVALLLGIVALAFVLYPLYRRTGAQQIREPSAGQWRSWRPPVWHPQGMPLQVASLEQAEREQTARTALQEVELDFQLGNLAEPDYRSLRERYMRRAFLAMKSRQVHEQELDEEIEEQLRHLKENNADTTE
jgi:hypothetical protein